MDPHILDWFFQGYVAKECCLVDDWLARLEHPARQDDFFWQIFCWIWGLKSWKCIGQLLKTVLGKASRKVENSQSIAWTGTSKKENRDMSFFIFWPCCNSWASTPLFFGGDFLFTVFDGFTLVQCQFCEAFQSLLFQYVVPFCAWVPVFPWLLVNSFF